MTKSLKERFENAFVQIGLRPEEDEVDAQFLDILCGIAEAEIELAKKEAAQQCYLECLAIGCGETEYSEAINSKFSLNESTSWMTN